MAIADALDVEREAKGPRDPLHGIPITLKDNIVTADRMTPTAGLLALASSLPAQDAFVLVADRAEALIALMWAG